MFLESKERTNHATLYCRMLLVALWPGILLKKKKWTSENDNWLNFEANTKYGTRKMGEFHFGCGAMVAITALERQSRCITNQDQSIYTASSKAAWTT